MTSVVQIAMPSAEMGEALDQLVLMVDAKSVRLSVSESVPEGTRIRFRMSLSDGTPFWEGMGMCRACEKVNGSGYRAVLTELSFDAGNEAIYERILMLSSGRDSGRPPDKGAPARKGGYATSGRTRAAPAKLSAVLRRAMRPKPASRPPRREAVKSLDVPPEAFDEAAELVRHLNLAAPSLARGRWTEERVLATALRMGLRSLAGLVDRRPGSATLKPPAPARMPDRIPQARVPTDPRSEPPPAGGSGSTRSGSTRSGSTGSDS